MQVFRESDNVIVAEYSYDSWGNILSATGEKAEENPFRYRGYYYDRETGFYATSTRYYDPEIGRFINLDSYISTGQGVLGYNMFAYCLNNAVNMEDSTGTDAIYVTDYRVKFGIPVVGHAYLFLQDSKGVWYKTEYAGSKKSNAKIYVYSEDDTVDKMLKGKILYGLKYTYISGDFTDSLALARRYKGTNYGGYDLFTNNCLHYAREILLASTFTFKTMQQCVSNNKSIVPREFHRALASAFAIDRVKGVKLYVDAISKPIYIFK